MTKSAMFRSTRWRLAILNTAVTTIVVAIAGLLTFSLVRSQIDAETDHALAERVAFAEYGWRDALAGGVPAVTPSPAPVPISNLAAPAATMTGDEPGESASLELVESGDALVFVFDRTGRLVDNPRNVSLAGLPSKDSVARALTGDIDTRTLHLGEDATVRVYTDAIVVDGQIVGAVQAVRGQSLRQSEIRAIGWASLLGAGLGTVFAVSAGIFLARRAMRPVEAAFQRQQTFVADASHELRTPLALIRANIELIQRLPDLSPGEIQTELAAVIDEVDETSRLVRDLLLLARADGAELAIQRQPVDLDDLVRETVTAMSPRATAVGIDLRAETVDPMVVEGDPDRLRQVVRILLDNAISYTQPNGSVTVSIGRRNHLGVVTVRDTGIGIALRDQAAVFDRFYRADLARSRATGGTGLGLPIARAIVAAHGGQIALESQPGQGTTVRVELPGASRR